MLDATETGSRQGHRFPVSLICPACKQALEAPGCGCPAGTRLTFENGMPRTLFGQKYWGETSSAKMARIVELTKSMHWTEALERVAKGVPMTEHLTASVGPDIVHSFPWHSIETVLDIGAGLGFVAGPMAHYGKTIVALEAVPERARFLRMRAEQDGLSIHPIVADALAMPFPDGSFDLITLNGVFEYLGLWAEGDPEQIHRDFLERVFRLLRPNGYLYIGTKTRLALSALLGGTDHSGLAFTSMMPRRIADLYCRVRTRPVHGAEHTARGYRTYTYTAAKYERMLKVAGFGAVLTQGAFDGNNHQIALYDLKEHALRLEIRNRVDAPSSIAGEILRRVTNAKSLYRTLESEVAIFASKDARTGPLLWRGLCDDHKIAQVNTYSKVLAFCFAGGKIQSVFERGKTPLIRQRMARSFAILERAQAIHGQDLAVAEIRWARPFERRQFQGYDHNGYEFVDGRSLAELAQSRRANHTYALALFEKALNHYPQLCRRLTQAIAPPAIAKPLEHLMVGLKAVCTDQELVADVEHAVNLAHRRSWATDVIHGDLSGNNTIVTSAGQLCLIDWESVTEYGLPAVDLIRLYYDLVRDFDDHAPGSADRLIIRMRHSLQRALEQLGYERSDFASLEVLFLGHQTEMVGAKSGNTSAVASLVRSGKASIRNFD